MFKIQLMYPKLKINVYFIFSNIGDLTFGITLVVLCYIIVFTGSHVEVYSISPQDIMHKFIQATLLSSHEMSCAYSR